MLLLAFSCNPECIGLNCADPLYTPKYDIFYGEDTPEKSVEFKIRITHTGEWVYNLFPLMENEQILIGSPQESAVYTIVPKRDRTWDLKNSTPTLTLPSTKSFGHKLGRLRRINTSDLLLITAPKSSHIEDQLNIGAVFIYDESNTQLVEIRGNQNGFQFGDAVTTCGDLDNDGWDDWIAAQTKSSSNDEYAGEVILGLSKLWKNDSVISINSLPRIVGDSVGARFGISHSCDSDLDGDGQLDILIGAPFQDNEFDASGSIYMFNAIPEVAKSYTISELPHRTYEGREAESWLGWSFMVENILGDNQPELIAGAPGIKNGSGEIWIWRGEELEADSNRLPRFRIESNIEDFRLGQSLDVLDMNGDGFDDLLLGAPMDTLLSRLNSGGGSYAFYGRDSSTSWPPIQSLSDADWRINGSDDAQLMGLFMMSADLNQDGYDDWALYSAAPK